MNGSAFSEILPKVIHGKGMLSSIDVDEGRYSTTLIFQMTFTTFIFRQCQISQVIQGKSRSSIRADTRRRRQSGTQKRKFSYIFLGFVEFSTQSSYRVNTRGDEDR
jgi:hypothetical protein